MSSTETDLGEVNYTAYLAASGGVSLVTGEPLPAWDALPGTIREAWRAGAAGVKAAAGTVTVTGENGLEERYAAEGAAVAHDGTLTLGSVDAPHGMVPYVPSPVAGFAPGRWTRFRQDGTLLGDDTRARYGDTLADLGTALAALLQIRDWGAGGSPERDVAAAALREIGYTGPPRTPAPVPVPVAVPSGGGAGEAAS